MNAHKYLPHTPGDIERGLRAIGVQTIGDLFSGIPEKNRLHAPLAIEDALSEFEVKSLLNGFASKNSGSRMLSFLGAGAYPHHSPQAVDAILSRGEFLTAYTPYQPEISQGTLQAIFEYQTSICALLDMEVANASNYDGSTALAEAALMAERITGKKSILYAEGLHPEYLSVLKTYLSPRHFELTAIPLATSGVLDLNAVEAALKAVKPAALIVEHPNFFGSLEDMTAIAELVHRESALLISATTDLSVYGILKPPGAFGVDIAVGEGQSLGLPLNFGGPYLGVFATRREYLRAMPGRLVGRTLDKEGKTAYTLTLSTREQHIRREKATSNICTNQGLCALAVTVYLGLLGKQGIAEVAEYSTRRAHALANALQSANCGRLAYSAPYFHEFTLALPKPAREVAAALKDEGIIPGLDLGRFNPAWANHILIATTELHSDRDCERLVKAIAKEITR